MLRSPLVSSFLLCLALATGSAAAFAGVEQLGEGEFRALANELSPKVNLFHDAWEKDPAAQFYGGTTRDYLYWLKGKFRDAKSPAEAKAVADALRAAPVIDVREFIIGDSDVDIFSDRSFEIKASDYGVKKVDTQRKEVLDPTTALGKNEVDQGFLPAEKIRLGREGLAETPGLGHGVKEIYSGHLTAHFTPPEQFARSKYAADGINHPILLALRYLRLQAINYFQTHGPGPVKKEQLLAALDPASAAEVRKILDEALGGDALAAPLKKPQFKKWINAAIQKAFRSYTNPNAAKALMEEFRVTELPNIYPKDVEPVNQYVFAKQRDEAAAARALKEDGIDPASFFRNPREEFPDGFLYHGTKTEPAFRGILFQGVLGSESGSAGAGLYGVPLADKQFAEKWAGDPGRLLRFPVKPEARIVDIREGEGKRAWDAYHAKHGPNYEAFADRYDIDLLAYPYNAHAFVVKNSEALGRAEGVYRAVLSLPELIARARTHPPIDTFLDLFQVNQLSKREADLVVKAAGYTPAEIEAFVLGAVPERDRLGVAHTRVAPALKVFFSREPMRGRYDILEKLLDLSDDFKSERVTRMSAIATLLSDFPNEGKEDFLLKLHDRWGASRQIRDYMTQILEAEGAPAMPKLLQKLLAHSDRDAAVFAVFGRAGYEPLEAHLGTLLKHGDLNGNEAAMLLNALAKGTFVHRLDWVRTILAGPGVSTTDRERIFSSAPWVRAHPDFFRDALKKLMESAHSATGDYIFASWCSTPGAPFDEELLQIAANRRSSVYRFAEHINSAGLKPFRQQALAAVLNAEVLVEPYDLRRLAAAVELTPEQRAKAERLFERYLEKDAATPQLLTYTYRLAIDDKPSARATEIFDERFAAFLRDPDFADRHAGLLLADTPVNENFAKDIQAHFARWLEKLDERKDFQEIARLLVRHGDIRPFQPFVRELLRRPELPVALRIALKEQVPTIVDDMLKVGAPLEKAELVYRIAERFPETLKNPETFAKVRTLAAAFGWKESGALFATLLLRSGHESDAYRRLVEDFSEALAQRGIAVTTEPFAPAKPAGCDALYSEIKP